MKFYFELLDCSGNVLNEGDIVRITTHRNGPIFYSEVRYLPEKIMIVPFHNFAFKTVERVNEIPKEAKQLNEVLFKAWVLPDGKSESDETHYAIEWGYMSHSLTRIVQVNKIEGQIVYQGKLF